MSPDRKTRSWKQILLRLAITLVAVGLWFWTQSLIGTRQIPTGEIGDGVHTATAALNHYFETHTGAANALLVVTSGMIDLLALFLFASWIFGPSVRPFLALLMVIALRQTMQALVALPNPPHLVWHYPGFPSLLVTYGVASDYFFSGHTSVAVLGACELARLRKPWLTTFAIAVALFEMATVLVLRAHYTMDVFTGALAAILSSQLAAKAAPRIDCWFDGVQSRASSASAH